MDIRGTRMLSILILLVTLSEARAGLDGAIGVMGDSYSDEYQFYPPDRSTARNWVEILAQTRGLDFGAFSTVGRGEPRNQGYAYNWARSDATTDDLIATGQHTGLAAQVARGEVKLVMICVGGNDFINALKSPEPTATLAEVLPRALANYRLAVHTILDADPRVKLVLATLSDICNLPEFDGPIRAGRLPREVADAFSAAIRKFNAQIKVLAAADRRIAVLDLDGTTRLANLVRRDTVCVDGLRLDRTHPSNRLDAFFLGDSRHPGTIGQGLLAKLFIDTINARFDAGIAPLSGREIVAYARSIPPSPAWGLDRRLTVLGVGSRNPASSPGQ
jgi:phospholipase/lecithinase/hemolysin